MAETKLKGISVIVTRPERQAQALCRAVEDAGGKALTFPALSIEPASASRQKSARHKLAALKPGDWVIFVSPNAVDFGMEYMPGGRLPDGVRAAAVGAATTSALQRIGVRRVLYPRSGYDSEALLKEPDLQRLDGRQVYILKAVGGRRKLTQTLKQRGAAVTPVVCYRRERPRVDPRALGNRLPERGPIVTTATSAQLLRNLLQMVDPATQQRLRQASLVVISRRLARLAQRLGFRDVTVSEEPGTQAMVAALARAIQSR